MRKIRLRVSAKTKRASRMLRSWRRRINHWVLDIEGIKRASLYITATASVQSVKFSITPKALINCSPEGTNAESVGNAPRQRLQRWKFIFVGSPGLSQAPTAGLELANAFGVSIGWNWQTAFGVSIGWNWQTASAFNRLELANSLGVQSAGVTKQPRRFNWLELADAFGVPTEFCAQITS